MGENGRKPNPKSDCGDARKSDPPVGGQTDWVGDPGNGGPRIELARPSWSSRRVSEKATGSEVSLRIFASSSCVCCMYSFGGRGASGGGAGGATMRVAIGCGDTVILGARPKPPNAGMFAFDGAFCLPAEIAGSRGAMSEALEPVL